MVPGVVILDWSLGCSPGGEAHIPQPMGSGTRGGGWGVGGGGQDLAPWIE